MALSDTSISSGIKDSFDALLSFEIGKSASLALNIIDNMQNNLSQLFSNSLPAINTIISEHDEYKYNEQQLRDKYPDYSTTLESLR
ncbi:hypothetical protein J6T66_01760 [bacterium]|nr:hypothetical protein [bacterium]